MRNTILMILSIVFNENRNLYEVLYTINGKLNHFAYSLETLEYVQNKIKEIY